MKSDHYINNNDKKVLKELAKHYIEIANLDIMHERKKLWKDLHDLNPQRSMILFEPLFLEGYLSDYKLRCEDDILRNVEYRIMIQIRQFEQLDDDIVFEPYFRLPWWGKSLTATSKDFGNIKIEEIKAKTQSLAYLSNFPIKKPADIKKLKHRTLKINKNISLNLKARLDNIFGDILPVKVGNYDNFGSETGDFGFGNSPFIGQFFIGLTWDIFKLIGNEAMMMWMYDYPDVLHELCRFLTEEKKNFFNFLIKEGLLDFNTDNQFACGGSYGYVTDLPAVGSKKEIGLKDLWTWAESQETQAISPSKFDEFFLPYIAEIANMFGLSYYGCCERITDRFEYINKAIKNIRSVSVSGWSNWYEAGEILGKNFVYSRKPIPAYVSTPTINWGLVEKEAKQTAQATKNCNVEIIFRDIYSSNCTPNVAKKYIKIWKQAMGI